jgi:hypothetical protein
VLAKRLARDDALRAAIVASAQTTVQKHETASDAGLPKELITRAADLSLPLGWQPIESDPYKREQVPDTRLGWLLKGIGLLITVLAVSLGAPFWFDTLSTFVNVRGAGTPPGETKKSAPQTAQKDVVLVR